MYDRRRTDSKGRFPNRWQGDPFTVMDDESLNGDQAKDLYGMYFYCENHFFVAFPCMNGPGIRLGRKSGLGEGLEKLPSGFLA